MLTKYPHLHARDELEFPRSLSFDPNIGKLEAQAYVLEYGAFQSLTPYAYTQKEAVWITHLASKMVSPSEELTSLERAQVEETRLSMTYGFNDRLERREYSPKYFSGILAGLSNFEQPAISEVISPLLDSLGESDESDYYAHPNYIGSGNNAHAFLLEAAEGQEHYVVKVGRENFQEDANQDMRALSNLQRWLGLVSSYGLPNFEQPIAFSSDKVVSITRFVPGLELLDISVMRDKPLPSNEQLDDLAYAVHQSIRNGIRLDIHERDFMYDEKAGFTIIDQGIPTLPERNIENQSLVNDYLVSMLRRVYGDSVNLEGFRRTLEEFTKQAFYDLSKSAI